MNFSQIQKELPSNSSAKALKQFFEGVDTEKYLDRKERQFWKASGANQSLVDAQIGMLRRRVEGAKATWACISAKSQREKNYKSKNGVRYEVNIYDNLTTISPDYERSGGMNPPDRTGTPIFEFSKRSQKRLMAKARKLNKNNLPLPFFVTLTYRDNYRDPKGAKKHLNTFFQRWRRKDRRFAYFWKMEPQKRGAVHFHLAMFIPQSTQKAILQDRKYQLRDLDWEASRLNALRLKIQRDWAEVTKEVDGVRIPYTDQVFVDPVHEWYGTNVRKVDNWKMFLGYCYKYIGKECKNPFGEDVETGRFWGFSYNMDFDPLKTRMVDQAEIDNLNDFCETLNVFTFSRLIDHLKSNAERKKKELADRPEKLKKELQKYRAVYEAQKRRYEINKEKIREGYSQQFEIDSHLAKEFEKYLNGTPVREFFGIYNNVN